MMLPKVNVFLAFLTTKNTDAGIPAGYSKINQNSEIQQLGNPQASLQFIMICIHYFG